MITNENIRTYFFYNIFRVYWDSSFFYFNISNHHFHNLYLTSNINLTLKNNYIAPSKNYANRFR